LLLLVVYIYSPNHGQKEKKQRKNNNIYILGYFFIIQKFLLYKINIIIKLNSETNLSPDFPIKIFLIILFLYIKWLNII
jgi:hypothetical protein